MQRQIKWLPRAQDCWSERSEVVVTIWVTTFGWRLLLRTSSTFGLVGAASPRPDTSVLIDAVVEIYYGLTEGSAGKPAANKQETSRIPGRALYTADNRTQAPRAYEAHPTHSRDRKPVPRLPSLQVDAQKCLIRTRNLDESRSGLALDLFRLAENLVWMMLRRQSSVRGDDHGAIR